MKNSGVGAEQQAELETLWHGFAQGTEPSEVVSARIRGAFDFNADEVTVRQHEDQIDFGARFGAPMHQLGADQGA